MRIRVVAVVLILSGCAARGPKVPPYAEFLGKAEALLGAGCYVCLQESQALLAKVLSSKTPPPGAAEKAFDVALLIAIREKELGIPGDASMAAALRLLPAAPDRSSVGEAKSVAVPRRTVYDAAQLIAGDLSALDPDMRAKSTADRVRVGLGPDNPARRALDAAPDTDLAAKYVALSIDCEQQKLIESIDMPAMRSKYDGVPLMLFKLSTCGRPAGPSVGALRAGDPRWADTLYWEGRRELAASLGTAIDFPKALGFFADGRKAFPDSLLLTMAWANTNMAGEEFEGALSGFDEVIAKYPTHRDALSGRMQALSYLMRHVDAIEAATRLLDLGTWHIGDANYWRAWNRYHLKDYESAWIDIENATKGLSNARVYMLAGLIAYSRKDLPTAVQRFDHAFQIDSTACDAVWMSGLVNIDQNELATAAPKFTRSMTCFTSSAAALRGDAARIRAVVDKRGTPATPREQRNLERSERDASNAEEKSAQSAYNAAQCYARTGDRGLALNLIDVAIDHPAMKEKAMAMKAAIEKLPK
ncbi:MAG TPA: hypothetical protein VEA16_07225 [Vicinamibacterales bacterium]|nr:hypothetical protein [Vicinamibacterales bacterium]